ncbi:hypothetical protein LJR030_000418 [Rhizobium sp. LjRoot30]|uniref:hypothetical protein n=1 Tax=Rhizobium sp. LjRoot30 TaxID=3342320 RepID=UPI003ECEA415
MSGSEVETLQALMRRHGIAEVLYEDAKGRVSLPVGRSAALPSPEPAARISRAKIQAPHAGLFRLRHPLDDAPAAAAPRPVRKGDIVAYLQVGALLRPVVAPQDGRIGQPLVAEGAVTGYCSPLFAYL